ncbi:peptidoglycan-recognition protein LB-like [Aphomia sociella]
MFRFTCFVLLTVIASTIAIPKPRNVSLYDFNFVSRAEWGANLSRGVTPLSNPVQFVVIHHSYEPGVCMTFDECKSAMQSMQNFHQNGNGWSDIGYNFAVGGEGRVYEGRGWDAVGAHAVGYNSDSIGICLIGDWVATLPPQAQLEATKQLIAAGVELGYIHQNYRLIGHRQASATECPGDVLYREIMTWNQFSTTK